ncbi:MAG: AMP-binding protein [Candidatus Methanofastidiosia archaeon]|jgi:phenylacetate-CoA ligase
MLPRQLYFLSEVMRTQWKDPAELKKLQEKKVRKILQYAYKNNRFYHDFYKKHNVSPSDFKTLDDIRKFPQTTKRHMLENYPDNIVSKGYNHLEMIKASTSGSTGQNLNLVYDKRVYEHYMAVTYRNLSALGYKPWHRLLYTRYEPFKIENTFYQKFGVIPRKWISVWLSTEEQIKMLRKFKPHALTVYPSIAVEWAKTLKQQGEHFNIPVFIRAEAEILTKEAKELIEEIFGCTVYEEYGSAEFVVFAWECQERGYHMSVDNVYMEFLDDEGEPVAPGEEGEIIATALEAKAMPFIRYKINDRGVPLDGQCPCGRTLPLMKLVVGRDDDFLWLPSGNRVNPRQVIPHFELAPGIKEFKIVQEKKDYLSIDIIPGPEFTKEEQQKLKKKLMDVIQEEITIEFNLRDEIPQGRHGRPRPILSKVNK